jgi:hypothetical protein
MSAIWIDCPTDGLTVSPPFCIRGGYLTGHAPVTLQAHILCPGRDPVTLTQTAPPKQAPSYCFKVTAAPEGVVTLVVSLAAAGREEASSAVYDVSVVPAGGSDCQCPEDCPSPAPGG